MKIKQTFIRDKNKQFGNIKKKTPLIIPAKSCSIYTKIKCAPFFQEQIISSVSILNAHDLPSYPNKVLELNKSLNKCMPPVLSFFLFIHALRFYFLGTQKSHKFLNSFPHAKYVSRIDKRKYLGVHHRNSG